MIDDYVAGVAAHLGSLPDDERAELLHDLREHLAEVAAEDTGSLTSRLGPPDAYAADLLASAGLTVGEPSGGGRWTRIGRTPLLAGAVVVVLVVLFALASGSHSRPAQSPSVGPVRGERTTTSTR